MTVKYSGKQKELQIVFINSTREKGIFDRPWFDAFKTLTVTNVNAEHRLSALIEEFADVFESSTGCIRGHKAHLIFKENAQFRLNRARPVPYAYRPAVESELIRLQQDGIISQGDVQNSRQLNWSWSRSRTAQCASAETSR